VNVSPESLPPRARLETWNVYDLREHGVDVMFCVSRSWRQGASPNWWLLSSSTTARPVWARPQGRGYSLFPVGGAGTGADKSHTRVRRQVYNVTAIANASRP
jgi:hypothetical protein